jgi:GTP-binding protein
VSTAIPVGPTATVAIVGRPNVGKSTLFNRLIGERKSIVFQEPGVTRDRVTGMASIGEDGEVLLIDTGGLVPGDDPLGLNQQVFFAIEESDLLLFVVDGKDGLVAADERIWGEIRRRDKPTVLVVNKGDVKKAAEEGWHEFYALGIDPQILISAEHGRGIEDVREAIGAIVPARPSEPVEEGVPRLAIVGRPNVGKSSILNQLVGESRALVSPVPGTTRDPLDTRIEVDGQPYLLVDTAGIRRRSKTSGEPEELAVMMARRQIERADMAVLVLDASAGVTTGDLSIAGAAWELGKATLVLVNKWDLLDARGLEELEESWPRMDQVLASPQRVNISAKSGRGLEKIFAAVGRVLEGYECRLETSEVNRLFERAVARHGAPADRGKPWKLFYATQVSSRPPTFMLFANRTLPRQASYRRYLENFLQKALDLPGGIPTRLVIRKR